MWAVKNFIGSQWANKKIPTDLSVKLAKLLNLFLVLELTFID
jgi:hypothetical protein